MGMQMEIRLYPIPGNGDMKDLNNFTDVMEIFITIMRLLRKLLKL